MRELNIFRKFLNETLEEGFFDMFKKEKPFKSAGLAQKVAAEEVNFEVAGEMIKAAKATLPQMTDEFAPALIQKKLQDLDDLWKMAREGGDPGRLTDEGIEQLEIGIKNILNLAKYDL